MNFPVLLNSGLKVIFLFKELSIGVDVKMSKGIPKFPKEETATPSEGEI